MRNLVVVLVVLSCTCICHAGLGDDLVGYYNFDNNLDDLSGSANVNDAVAVGSPDFSIGGLFGGGVKVGDGFGTSYVSLGMPSDYLFGDSTSFTITYWLKMPASQASDPGLIGNKNWSSTGGAQGFTQAIIGDDVKANIADGSTRADTATIDLDHDVYWDGQGKAADDPVRWTFVAITVDRSTNVLTDYVMDGWVINQWDDASTPRTAGISSVGSLDSGYPINIGQDGDGAGYDNSAYPELVASFDDMAVWRRALSTDEIWEIYTAGRAGQPIVDIIPALRGVAHTPTPDNNQDFVDKTIANLEWLAPPGQGVNKYDVYFGTDPNELSPTFDFPKIMDYREQTTVDPSPVGDLDPDTLYFWQVDTYEPNSPGPDIFHEGDLWNFRTAPDSPVIQTQPVGIVIAAGETAEFVVGGINIVTYTWYKSDDAANDTPGDDVQVGELNSLSPLLSIPDVQFADEGYYYCVAAYGGLSDVSDVASLVLEQLINHYLLDNQSAADAVGGVTGTVVGNPSWIGGIDGGAIDFDPTDGTNDHVVLGTASDLNFGSTDDFSVAFWLKTTGWDADAGIISNKDWNYSANTGWGIFGGSSSDGTLRCNFNGGANVSSYMGGVANGDPKVSDGQWHHVCVTYDRDGLQSAYMDGELRDADSIAGSTATVDAGYPTVVGTDGAEGAVWAYWFNGSVDDLRIFNYVLDDVEVATLYADFNPGVSICVNRPVLDLVENCRVDLADLVVVVEAWMECGRIPVEACNL